MQFPEDDLRAYRYCPAYHLLVFGKRFWKTHDSEYLSVNSYLVANTSQNAFPGSLPALWWGWSCGCDMILTEYYTSHRFSDRFMPWLVPHQGGRGVTITLCGTTSDTSPFCEHLLWPSPTQMLLQGVPRPPECWLLLVFKPSRVSPFK
jgi:hypothetical protein